jgi:hypothetical protein
MNDAKDETSYPIESQLKETSFLYKFFSQRNRFGCLSHLEKVTAYLQRAEASSSVVSATPLWA